MMMGSPGERSVITVVTALRGREKEMVNSLFPKTNLLKRSLELQTSLIHEWRILVSVNQAIIASDKCVSLW